MISINSFSVALQPFYPRTESLTPSLLSERSFLKDVVIFDVDESSSQLDSDGSSLATIVNRVLETGSVEIVSESDQLPEECAAAIAIPVHRNSEVVSVVVLLASEATTTINDPVGVFEFWQPIGAYEELALHLGYFGRMERFQNVSSFVRFEKGSGLPGKVWEDRRGLVQNDLPNHPGFLRAAGASADLLQTAIGLPIASRTYHGTAVLINSHKTPIARGLEVWKASVDCFELTSAAYHDLGDTYPLEVGTTVGDEGILGMVRNRERAVLVEDTSCLMPGRSTDLDTIRPVAAVAIPVFDATLLTSVAILLF